MVIVMAASEEGEEGKESSQKVGDGRIPESLNPCIAASLNP